MDDNKPEQKFDKLSNPDEVLSLIMESPGITGKELGERLDVNNSNIYNYVARLRQQCR